MTHLGIAQEISKNHSHNQPIRKVDAMPEKATAMIEMGLDTFGDVTVDKGGKLLSQAEVLRNVVEEGVLADQVGIDFIGVGEHHRDDFAVSAPDVVLAAIAGRTKRIHLGSAVTVLSSDDPIRVFQRFSTLDALSNGRAEVTWAVAPSRNPSRCLATRSMTMSDSSRKNWTSLPSS